VVVLAQNLMLMAVQAVAVVAAEKAVIQEVLVLQIKATLAVLVEQGAMAVV
jgi:hypothetical protein